MPLGAWQPTSSTALMNLFRASRYPHWRACVFSARTLDIHYDPLATEHACLTHPRT